MRKKSKLKRVLLAAIPSKKDFTIFFKSLMVFLIVSTFAVIFFYSSTSSKAEYAQLAGSSGMCEIGRTDGSTCSAGAGFIRGIIQAPVAGQLAEGVKALETALQNETGYAQIDFGATGRILNATSSIYETEIAHPTHMLDYYANRAAGKAYAANPTSGREVLTPIFFLSQTFRNFAYGIVIIILIVSSLSILLQALTGNEQKVTIVQLMVNTGVCLVLATFFYEIAAIIYDFGVNYGNSFVASIMEPFINAKVILERLQPGGDINVTALTNTFQFIGVSDAFAQILSNVTAGFHPALTQSMAAVPYGIPGNDVIGKFLSYFASPSSIGLNMVLSNLLGSTALFDAVIAWVVFFINIKIFFHLLDAFIKYNLYVAFGPLLSLQGINGGYDKISNQFKLLFTYALVFPVTFLFILLGATSLNIFIRNSDSGEVEKSVLCVYSTSDPANTESDIMGGTSIGRAVIRFFGYSDPGYDDPSVARNRNYINQNIFDTKPSFKNGETRSCRSNLFPVPWTFVPAPFGNFGNKLVQSQTIDTLVRTFLGLAFLIMASRATNLLLEVMDVKEFKSFQGFAKSIMGGVGPTVGFGLAGLTTGFATARTALNSAVRVPIPGLALLTNNFVFNWLRRLGSNAKKRTFSASLADAYGSFTKADPQDIAEAAVKAGETVSKVEAAVKSAALNSKSSKIKGLASNQAAMDSFIQNSGVWNMFSENLAKSSQVTGLFANAISLSTNALNQFLEALSKGIGDLNKILSMIGPDLID